MRRWIARQFQRDRRWRTVMSLISLAWFAYVIAGPFIFTFHSRVNWEEENRISRETLAQAQRIADPAEQQRVLQEGQVRDSRLQKLLLQESAESLRLSEIHLRMTKWAGGAFVLVMIVDCVGIFREKRRQRWLKSRCCGECGYDLRAHALGLGERCPECGTGIDAAAGALRDASSPIQ